MLDLTATPSRDLRRRRCFFAPDERPGWERFYSGDPRFTLTVAVPNGMLQMIGSCRFHTFEANFQELIFDDCMQIVRTDLNRTRATRGELLSVPLHTMDRHNASPRPMRRHRYRIGGLPGSMPECTVYGNGATRVWFESTDRELWSFERTDDFPDDLFIDILAGARFLSAAFFAALPTDR